MLAVKLRKEIQEAESEVELIKILNPVIGWQDFEFPKTPRAPASIGGLEGDPEWFFLHTYPTSVINELIDGIRNKLEGKAPGIFPLYGKIGSGKSHAALTIYHLFTNPKQGDTWLKKWNLFFRPPQDVTLIPLPLQTISVRNLWDPIFKVLGYEITIEEGDWPKHDLVRKAVGDKPTIILIDEIDNWFEAKSKEEKARTRGFIQVLSEVSADERVPLVVIITCLGISEEVKMLIDMAAREVGGSMVVIERPEDIYKILKFRLFDEVKDEAKGIVSKYIELYRDIGLKPIEKLTKDMLYSYPFHTSFLRALSALKVRQLLLILAKIVRRNFVEKDLIISLDLDDDIIRSFLESIDPKMVSALFDDLRFVKDYKDVQEGIYSYDISRGFLVTALLNSLESGQGIPFEEIVFGAVREEEKLADLEMTLEFLHKWTRLKKIEDRYILTTELPPAIRIERRAETIGGDEALKRLDEMLRRKIGAEIREYKVYFGAEELEDGKRFKTVVLMEKPSNLSKLYENLTYENTLVFLYPTQSLLSNSIIKLVKRVIASEELMVGEGADIEIYKEFNEDYRKSLEISIKNADWQTLIWSRTSPKAKPTPVEKTLPEFKRLKEILQPYASKDNIRYFTERILEESKSITIKDLKERFYRLRGAPILLDENDLYRVVSDIAFERIAVLKGAQGRTYFGERVSHRSITEDNELEKPPEIITPPSVGDVMQLITEKKKLTFNDIKTRFPFPSEEDLKQVLLDTYEKHRGTLYLIEERKIVRSTENVKRAILVTKEEATKAIETMLLRTVKDALALKTEKLSKEISKFHPGVDENLVQTAAENLEIYGKVSIDRKAKAVALPREELFEDLARKIYSIIREKGEIMENTLISSITNEIPVDEHLVKDAIEGLIGKRKIIRVNGKLSRPIGLIPKLPPPRLWKSEGSGIEVLNQFNSEIEDGEIFATLWLEAKENVTKESIKKIIKALTDVYVKVRARRKTS